MSWEFDVEIPEDIEREGYEDGFKEEHYCECCREHIEEGDRYYVIAIRKRGATARYEICERCIEEGEEIA